MYSIQYTTFTRTVKSETGAGTARDVGKNVSVVVGGSATLSLADKYLL